MVATPEQAKARPSDVAPGGRPQRLPHMPALDGIRGLALIAVIFFHSQFDWAKGGYLGVTTFFVLSGFLITALLLRERDTSGTIDLRDFWERRIRRLAPAILVLVGLVIAYVALAAQRPSPTIFGDAVSVFAWVANWRFVLAGHSYANLFSQPSPFEHMWSLAVEEQVYLLLPVIALFLLGRRGPANRIRLGIGLAIAVVASTIAVVALRTPGAAPLHEYYGTDARLAEPVVGALLAIVLVGRKGLQSYGRWTRLILDVVALVGVAILGYLMSNMAIHDEEPYRGGFLVAALASAGVIAAASQREGLIARILGAKPLAALGRISYGAYLFHWPIFLWLTPTRTGLSEIPLLVLRCTATLGVAVISHELVEVPIRSGRMPMRIGVPAWAGLSLALLSGLALIVMHLPPAPTGFAEAAQPPEPPPDVSSVVAGDAAITGRAVETDSKAKTGEQSPTRTGGGPRDAGALEGTPTPADSPPAPIEGALRVAITGDSLAKNLATGLASWAESRSDVVTYDLTAVGCPISRGGKRRFPDRTDWPIGDECGWWSNPSSDRFKYLELFDPDIVVMHDGANEIPDRKLDHWPSYQHAGQPLFDQWLFKEYSTFIDTVTHEGSRFLGLNAVCGDWVAMGEVWAPFAGGEGSRRVRTLNTTMHGLRASGARIGDFYDELCPNGRFTTTVYGVKDARPDGYHLRKAAAKAVANQWLGPLILEMK